MSNSSTSKGKPVMIAIAVVALLAAGVIVWVTQSNSQATTPDRQWFYDVGTGELFDVGSDVIAPTEAPSGATLAEGQPGGVKAHVYACGSCADADERFVAYVSYLPPEAQSSPRGPLAVRPGDMPAAIPDEQMPAELEWQKIGDLQPQVDARIKDRCGDTSPVACAKSL